MQHFVGYAFDSDFAAGGNDSDVRFRFNARISPADLRQARALTVRSPHRPQRTARQGRCACAGGREPGTRRVSAHVTARAGVVAGSESLAENGVVKH